MASSLYFSPLADELQVTFPFFFELSALPYYLIIYTKEGQGKITQNNKTYLIGKNSLTLINGQLPFRVELYKCTSWHFQYCYISGPCMTTYFEALNTSPNILINMPPISKLPITLNHLLECIKEPASQADFIISKLITDLLTEMIILSEDSSDYRSSVPKYILEIKKLFDERFSESYNLDLLATQYNVSKYKIIRDFTRYLHSSPINYLINNRISMAKKLLAETDCSVNEIASQVGIDNFNHFIALFKKNTQVTPIGYRKLCHNHIENYLE